MEVEVVWHLFIGSEDGGTYLMRGSRQPGDLVIAVNVFVGYQIIFNTFTFRK